MDNSSLVGFYMGVFAIQITLATIIAAGIIALYQLNDRQAPKRSIGVVVNIFFLVAYFLASMILIAATAVFAWSLLGSHDVFPNIDFNLSSIARDDDITLLIIALTTAVFYSFFYILWCSRSLIDPKKYLERVSSTINSAIFADYLFHSYSRKPMGFIDILFVGRSDTKKQKQEKKKAKEDAEEAITNWEKRYDDTERVVDPLAVFVDYCRANATNASADVERVGIPMLEKAILNFVDGDSPDKQYFSAYIDDVTIDFRETLSDSSILLRKRYLDLLTTVALHHCEQNEFDSMVAVAKNIHIFTRGSDTDEVKTHAMLKLLDLTDTFKEKQEHEKDWRKVYHILEALTLIGARVAEDYYLNLAELAPVSIIENNNGEIEDFTGSMVNYFARYEDLHEKYPKAIPVIYFDAIDVSTEALATVMARSAALQEDLGITVSKYQHTVFTLYYIFYLHARAALKSQNGDLLRMSVYRLTQAMKFLKAKNLDEYMLDVADILVGLGIQIACSPYAMNMTSYSGTPLTESKLMRSTRILITTSLRIEKVASNMASSTSYTPRKPKILRADLSAGNCT